MYNCQVSAVKTSPSPSQRAKNFNRNGKHSASGTAERWVLPAGLSRSVWFWKKGLQQLDLSSETPLVYSGWVQDHCLLPGMLPERDPANPLPFGDAAVVLVPPSFVALVRKHSCKVGSPSLRHQGPTWGLPIFAQVSHHLKHLAWGMAHGPVDFSLWKSKCDVSPD